MKRVYNTIVIFLMTLALAACGTTGNTSRFTLPLDLPEGKKVSANLHVASAAMESNAAHLNAVNVQRWGRFGPDDLRNIEQSLQDTILPHVGATPYPADRTVDIHFVIRRYVVSTSNTGGAVLASVTWAATTSDGSMIYEEQFYASDAVYLIGTVGLLKDSVHKAIVRRIATSALAISQDPAARPQPGEFDKTFTSFEEAASRLPQSLVSMGDPALASFPQQHIRAFGLYGHSEISLIKWKVAEPSLGFDWAGYLDRLYEERQEPQEKQQPAMTAALTSSDVSVTTKRASSESQQRRLRIAILPSAARTTAALSLPGSLLRYTHELVTDNDNLELAYSYYSPDSQTNTNVQPTSLWSDHAVTKVPQDSRVYDIGKSLHADLAIMYFYRKKTAGWYSSDLFYLNVYVFDINKGRRIQSKADERSYKRIVEQALKEVIRESET